MEEDMTLQVLEGPTIQAGESLSDRIDCSAGQLVRITMPYTWDNPATSITFQFSTDGVFYNDMFGLDGYEVTIDTVVEKAGVHHPGAYRSRRCVPQNPLWHARQSCCAGREPHIRGDDPDRQPARPWARLVRGS